MNQDRHADRAFARAYSHWLYVGSITLHAERRGSLVHIIARVAGRYYVDSFARSASA